MWLLHKRGIEKEIYRVSPRGDLSAIRVNDRSANKSLRLKRCLNVENNKPVAIWAENRFVI